MLVENERQPQAEAEFQDRSDERVEKGVENRHPEDGIARKRLVIFQPDEDAVPADRRVGKAEPDAKAERIGQKAQQKHRGRQHEEQADGSVAPGDSAEGRGLLRG